MAAEFRLDFPPEVVRERAEVYARVRKLLAEQTLDAVQRARQLHLDWLQKHPDDYVALDAGKVLAMAEEAHCRTSASPPLAHRVPGTAKSEIAVPPEFFEPLPEEIIEAFYSEGRKP